MRNMNFRRFRKSSDRTIKRLCGYWRKTDEIGGVSICRMQRFRSLLPKTMLLADVLGSS
jgi:hypothetical protein